MWDVKNRKAKVDLPAIFENIHNGHKSVADRPVRKKWQVGAESHANDDEKLKIETGTRISIWRQFILRSKRRSILAMNWGKNCKYKFNNCRFIRMCKTRRWVTHTKQQKLISSPHMPWYNKNCILYPRPLRWWNNFLLFYMCHSTMGLTQCDKTAVSTAWAAMLARY